MLVDNINSSINDGLGSIQKQSDVDLTIPHLLTNLKTSFQCIKELFLQINENKEKLSFPSSKLIIEAPLGFTNLGEASVTVFSLEIRSKKIKNRGKLAALGCENSDLILKTNRIDNRYGEIDSINGSILWLSGRYAVLNNDEGIINSKHGIVRQAKSNSIVNPSKQLLLNRQGKICAREGLIDLNLPYIDNTSGIFEGCLDNMHVETFINNRGRLIVPNSVEMIIENRFDNESGIFEVSGALTLRNGLWLNSEGVITANLGVQANINELKNCNRGLIFSPKGRVNIITENNLALVDGSIDAAGAIILLSENGAVWGRNGRLLTPQMVAIESRESKIDLEMAAITAIQLSVKALSQINLNLTSLELQYGLYAFSKTQWIDINHVDFSKINGNILLDAEKYLNLENALGIIKGDLYIRSRGVDLIENDITFMSDVDIAGGHFNVTENNFNMSKGTYNLEAGHSIYSQKNELLVSEGCVKEKSGQWILKKNDSTVARTVHRETGHLTMVSSGDTAKSVELLAEKKLNLLQYRTETASLVIKADETALLDEVILKTEHTMIATDALWLSNSSLRFEQAKMHVLESIAIHETETAGKSLKIKAKRGGISINKTRNRTLKTSVKAKTDVNITRSLIEGDLETVSEKSQNIANCSLSKGDLSSTSTEGDISLRNNDILHKKKVAVKSIKGHIDATDNVVEADDSIKMDSQELFVTGSNYQAPAVNLHAQFNSLIDTSMEAKEIHITSEESFVLAKVHLKSEITTQISSDGFIQVQNSSANSLIDISLKAKNGFIESSTLNSDEGSVALGITNHVVVHASQIDGPFTNVQAEYALFKNSIVNSEVSNFKGSLAGEHSKFTSENEISVKGKKLFLDHSEMVVAEGNITLEMESEHLADASLSAMNITENSDEIVSLNSRAMAQYRLRRTAKTITSRGGFDLAANILQVSAQQSHTDQHLQASEAIDLVSFDLDISRSSILGPLSAKSSGRLAAVNTKVQGSRIEMFAGTDLLAPNLQARSLGSLKVHANQIGLLEGADLNSATMDLKANHLDRKNSEVAAENIMEYGHSLFAQGSKTLAKYASQIFRSGAMYLTGSTTDVEEVLNREASFIDHNDASSDARAHIYSGSKLQNDGGKLIFRGGKSDLNFERIDDNSASSLSGRGAVTINVKGNQAHVQHAQVSLDTLEVSANNLTIDGSITTSQVKLKSKQSDLVMNASVTSDRGVFFSYNRIKNNSDVHLSQSGDFTGYQVDNAGTIYSDGDLKFDQFQFKDIDNIHAKESLVFSSVSSIETHKTYFPKNLAFISKGKVSTKAPLQLANNFRAEGKSVDIDAPLHGKGRATIRAKGDLVFNHDSSFEKGMDVEAEVVTNNTRNVVMKGNSKIKCKRLENLCEVEIPKPLRFWGINFKRTSQPYRHTPANFTFENLDLSTQEGVFNEGSNIRGKNWILSGGGLHNRNKQHVHSFTKVVGTYSSYWGLGPKKDLLAWEHHIIVDGVAFIDIENVFKVDLDGRSTNDGVIHAGWMLGYMKEMDNGIFTNHGRTPEAYIQTPESLGSQTPFKTGGEVYFKKGSYLRIENLKNVGCIHSEGPMSVLTNTLYNERRKTTESEGVVRTNAWGNKKAHNETKDHLEPEWSGKIYGKGDTELVVGAVGFNRGGKIEGGSILRFGGDNFANEMQPLRTIKHFKSSTLPGQTAKGYVLGTDYVEGQVLSGGKMEVLFQGTFRNQGSSKVVSVDDLDMVVGDLQSEIIVGQDKVVEKRGFTPKDIYQPKIFAPTLGSITGKANILSTKGDLNIAGTAVGNRTYMNSAGDVNFIAKSTEVINTVHSISLQPMSLAGQKTVYNSTLSSIPNFISLDGLAKIVAKGNVGGTGNFIVNGDLDIDAESINLTTHQVNHWSKSSGFELSVGFFGSEAVKSAFNNEGFNPFAKAILCEDPLINDLFRLAAANGNEAKALQGLTTAMSAWQAMTQMSPAIASGSLGDFGAAIGHRVGLADAEGNFNPRVTFGITKFNNEVSHTESIPSRFSVKGDMNFSTRSDQSYEGIAIMGLTGGAHFRARKIDFINVEDSYKMTSSSFGSSVSIGPDGPSFGVNGASRKITGTSHRNGKLDFGNLLRIEAEAMTLSGIPLHAKNTDVKVRKIAVVSQYDTMDETHRGGSVSTTGAFSMDIGSSSSKTIRTIAGITAEIGGDIVTDHLTLTGGRIENIKVQAKVVEGVDMPTFNYQKSFGVSVGPWRRESGPKGFNALGNISLINNSQNGITRASIIGTENYAGLNSETHKVQENFKHKTLGLSIPIFTFDTENIQSEAQIISNAFRSKDSETAPPNQTTIARPRPIVEPPKDEKQSPPTPIKDQPKDKVLEVRDNEIKESLVNNETPLEEKKLSKQLLEEDREKVLTEFFAETDKVIKARKKELQATEEATKNLIVKQRVFEAAQKLKEDPTKNLTFQQKHEREQFLEMSESMGDATVTMGAIAAPFEAVVYVAKKGSDFYCNTSDQTRWTCDQTSKAFGFAFEETKNYIQKKIPEGVKNWWKDRQVAISNKVNYNEQQLAIPKEATLDFFLHGELNVLGAVSLGAYKAGRVAVKSITNIRTKSPAQEIIPPGTNDFRGLSARDVTPYPKAIKHSYAQPRQRSHPKLIKNRVSKNVPPENNQMPLLPAPTNTQKTFKEVMSQRPYVPPYTALPILGASVVNRASEMPIQEMMKKSLIVDISAVNDALPNLSSQHISAGNHIDGSAQAEDLSRAIYDSVLHHFKSSIKTEPQGNSSPITLSSPNFVNQTNPKKIGIATKIQFSESNGESPSTPNQRREIDLHRAKSTVNLIIDCMRYTAKLGLYKKRMPSAYVSLKEFIGENAQSKINEIAAYSNEEAALKALQEALNIRNLQINKRTSLSKDTHKATYKYELVQEMSFVVKENSASNEICAEILGYSILDSIYFKNLELYKPVAVGKYKVKGEFKYLIARSFVEGQSLEKMLQNIGSLTFSRIPRKKALQDFKSASEGVGEAYANLHAVRDVFEHNVKSGHEVFQNEQISRAISSFDQRLQSVNEKLLKMSNFVSVENAEKLANLVKAFKLEPGKMTFGFSSVKPSDFVWDTSRNSLGLTNCGNVCNVISNHEYPLISDAADSQKFINQIIKAGTLAGLKQSELREIENAFLKGYNSTYAKDRSKHAETFFKALYLLETLEEFADLFLLNQNEHVDKELIERFLKEFEDVLTPYKIVYVDDNLSIRQKPMAAVLNKVMENIEINKNFQNLSFSDAIKDVDEYSGFFPKLRGWRYIFDDYIFAPNTYVVQRTETKKVYKISRINKLDISNVDFVYIRRSENQDEILKEIFGFSFLNSLKLSELEFPHLLDMGKADGNYYLATSCQTEKGRNLNSILSFVGSTKINVSTHKYFEKQLTLIFKKAGSALGELQSSLKHKVKPTALDVELACDSLLADIKAAEKALTYLDISLGGAEQFNSLINAFQAHPGWVSYGLNDVSPKDFVWYSNKKTLSYVEPSNISHTVTASGRPVTNSKFTAFTSKDKYNFVMGMFKEGIEKGINENALYKLIESFEEHYYLEFKGNSSKAADDFFKAKYILRTVASLASLNEKNNDTVFNAQIKNLLLRLDSILQGKAFKHLEGRPKKVSQEISSGSIKPVTADRNHDMKPKNVKVKPIESPVVPLDLPKPVIAEIASKSEIAIEVIPVKSKITNEVKSTVLDFLKGLIPKILRRPPHLKNKPVEILPELFPTPIKLPNDVDPLTLLYGTRYQYFQSFIEKTKQSKERISLMPRSAIKMQNFTTILNTKNNVVIDALLTKKLKPFPDGVNSSKLMYGSRYGFSENALATQLKIHDRKPLLPRMFDEKNRYTFKLSPQNEAKIGSNKSDDIKPLSESIDPVKLLYAPQQMIINSKKHSLVPIQEAVPFSQTFLKNVAGQISKDESNISDIPLTPLNEILLPSDSDHFKLMYGGRFNYYKTIVGEDELIENVTPAETDLTSQVLRLPPPATLDSLLISPSSLFKKSSSSSSIDVTAIMEGPHIPFYGVESLQGRQPVEDFVKSVLGDNPYHLIEEPYLAKRDSPNRLYFVLDDDGIAKGVVKEFSNKNAGFVPELVSHELLRRVNLEHSVLPKIQGIGKYTSVSNLEKGLILYDSVSGCTIEDLFKLAPEYIPAFKIGKAFGEINAIEHDAPVDTAYLQDKMDLLKMEAEFALEKLSLLGLEAPFKMNDVYKLCKDVKRNPGRAGLVHGNASIEHLMFSDSKLALFGASSLVESVGAGGAPQGLPALDKYGMIVSMRTAAVKNGYSSDILETLINDFVAGYNSLRLGLSPESERFAELFWELNLINRAKANSPFLGITLANIKAKFFIHEKIVTGSNKEVQLPAGILPITSKQRRTLEAVFLKPPPQDILWGDVESLMRHLKAEVIQGQGSRVKFVLNGSTGSFHSPHNRNTKAGAIVSVRQFLERAGFKHK